MWSLVQLICTCERAERFMLVKKDNDPNRKKKVYHLSAMFWVMDRLSSRSVLFPIKMKGNVCNCSGWMETWTMCYNLVSKNKGTVIQMEWHSCTVSMKSFRHLSILLNEIVSVTSNTSTQACKKKPPPQTISHKRVQLNGSEEVNYYDLLPLHLSKMMALGYWIFPCLQYPTGK